jgi:ketosteroid isomerase-like protein
LTLPPAQSYHPINSMPSAHDNPFPAVSFPMARGALALAVMQAIAILAPGLAANAQQPGMHRSEKHEVRHEIDQLEENWRTAVLKSNTVAMAGLLADDYMAITASGTLQTKEQALANLRTGQTHITSLDLSDRKVRFYGATALVTSIAQVAGSTPEGDLSGSYRYTRVYVRDERGKWQIVSFEASRIREPGEHK